MAAAAATTDNNRAPPPSPSSLAAARAAADAAALARASAATRAQRLLAPLATGVFVGCILLSALLASAALAALALCPGSPMSWTLAAAVALLVAVPLGPPPRWAAAAIDFAGAAAAPYFSCRVVFEDEAALRRDRAYVIGARLAAAAAAAVWYWFGLVWFGLPLCPPLLLGCSKRGEHVVGLVVFCQRVCLLASPRNRPSPTSPTAP